MERLYAGQLAERAPYIANQLPLAGSAAEAARSVRYLIWAGDSALAAAAFEDALAHFEQLGDSRLLGVALFASTMHHWAWAQPARALATSDRAAGLTGAAGALWDLADGLPFVQLAQVLAGRPGDVVRLGEVVEPLARRLGHYGALMVAGRVRQRAVTYGRYPMAGADSPHGPRSTPDRR